MRELEKCRKHGIMIGVSTSRSEKNSMEFIVELNPDVVISSAGALVKFKDTYIYKAEFSAEETRTLIKTAREICGAECEITIDTVDGHYWNYKIDPKQQDKSWGDSLREREKGPDRNNHGTFQNAGLTMIIMKRVENPLPWFRDVIWKY